jgi:biotin carboxyl carrier protein
MEEPVTHAFRLQGRSHEVWLSPDGRGYALHMGDRIERVALSGEGGSSLRLQVGERSVSVYLEVRGDEVHVHLDGEAHTLVHEHPLERFASRGREDADAMSRAPMPGVVVSVPVRPGDGVARGDVLMVIESMKMETAIRAAFDGVVRQIHVAPGETFERDAVLVSLEPAGETA